jgi:hypothetical protein
LSLPLSVGIPLLNGAALDRLAGLGASSYRVVFVVMGLLIVASIVLLSRVDFEAAGAPGRNTTDRNGTP